MTSSDLEDDYSDTDSFDEDNGHITDYFMHSDLSAYAPTLDTDILLLEGHTFKIAQIRRYLDLYEKMPRSKRALIGSRLVVLFVDAIREKIWHEPIPVDLWNRVVKFLTLSEVANYFIETRAWMEAPVNELCEADWDDKFDAVKK